MMHVGHASRRSYAAFLGYHLGKVQGYDRSQDYPCDDMLMDTDGFEWTVCGLAFILYFSAVGSTYVGG